MFKTDDGSTMGDSKGGDEWSTPQWLFDYYNARFSFVLDAAASDTNHKCERYFTRDDDALRLTWRGYGSVWCNPPYSDPAPWVRKAIDEVNQSRSLTVVMLLPSDTSTAWFLEAYNNAISMVLFHGRIKFGGGSGSPRWGSVLFTFQSGRSPYHRCQTFVQSVKDIRNAID